MSGERTIMYQKKKYIHIFLTIAITWLFIFSHAQAVHAEEPEDGSKKKSIYIVYDNSYSTYLHGTRSYWAEINYGVQTFYTLTDQQDTVKIYFTSTDNGINCKNGYMGNQSGENRIRRN